MSKISGLIFALLAFSCFAQDADKGSPFAPPAVDGLARSQASIGAEARVREMETLLKLTTEARRSTRRTSRNAPATSTAACP